MRNSSHSKSAVDAMADAMLNGALSCKILARQPVGYILADRFPSPVCKDHCITSLIGICRPTDCPAPRSRCRIHDADAGYNYRTRVVSRLISGICS